MLGYDTISKDACNNQVWFWCLTQPTNYNLQTYKSLFQKQYIHVPTGLYQKNNLNFDNLFIQ